jgi:hypothetical protein
LFSQDQIGRLTENDSPAAPGTERALIGARAGQGRGSNQRFFITRDPLARSYRHGEQGAGSREGVMNEQRSNDLPDQGVR